MTTEKQGIRSVRQSYARIWVLVLTWASSLLVLEGASLLFSQIHQVDWRICAALSLLLLVSLVLLLTRSLVALASSSGRETASSSLKEDGNEYH